MFGFEPVLCWDVWYVVCDVRKNHLLECLCESMLIIIIIVSSNFPLQLFCTFVSYIIELKKVIQCAGMCREKTSYHMRRNLFIQSARTCCVFIEVAPFLLLLFTASVSSAESLEPTIPKRKLSLDLLCRCIVRVLEGSMMVLLLSGSPFFTSDGF